MDAEQRDQPAERKGRAAETEASTKDSEMDSLFDQIKKARAARLRKV